MPNQSQPDQRTEAASAAADGMPDYATKWQRILAFVMDFLIVGILFLGLLRIAFPVLLSNEWVIGWHTAVIAVGAYFVITLVPKIILAIYATLFCSSRWQATPGQYIARSKIVDRDGQRIGWSFAAIRQCSLISYGPFDLLGSLLLTTRNKRPHHDRVLETSVIRNHTLGHEHWVISVILLGVIGFGFWQALHIPSSLFKIWDAWQAGKQTILLDEHARLVDWMLNFANDKNDCPTTDTFRKDDKGKEVMIHAPSFQQIEFNPAGTDRCLLTAKLQVAWQHEWDERHVFYSFHRDTGDVTCDPIFLQASSLCRPSIRNTEEGSE